MYKDTSLFSSWDQNLGYFGEEFYISVSHRSSYVNGRDFLFPSVRIFLMEDGTLLAASKCSRNESLSSVQRKPPTLTLDYELI